MGSKTKIFIVMEFVTGGELFDKIVSDWTLCHFNSIQGSIICFTNEVTYSNYDCGLTIPIYHWLSLIIMLCRSSFLYLDVLFPLDLCSASLPIIWLSLHMF